MKKLIFLLGMVLYSTISLTQITISSKVLYEGKRYVEMTTNNGFIIEETIINDTLTVWKMSFRNLEYQYIFDMGEIKMYTQSELLTFIHQLQVLVSTPNDVDKTIILKDFHLRNSGSSIVFIDKDGKYTHMKKKNVSKLILEITDTLYFMTP
jgi:hypothetical protein